MTGPLGIGLMALAAGTGLTAQTPGRISADELRANPPQLFAERLLGRPAPEIVEAATVWHPGVAQYSAISAYFAPRPEPTAWDGLCRVEVQSVWLAFAEPRTADGVLVPEAPVAQPFYMLAGPGTPAPAGMGARPTPSPCSSLMGIFWRAAYVAVGDQSASADQAAFVYRAFGQARRARRIEHGSCILDYDACCADVGRLVRTLDLRDLWGLTLEPCRDAPRRLCATGHLGNREYGAYLTIEIETGQPDIGAARDAVRIRTVRVSAQMHPVA